jgi:hypothetical protein
MYFFSANDVKRLLIIPWESYKKAQWVSIVFNYFESPIMDVFLIFLEKKKIGKMRKV